MMRVVFLLLISIIAYRADAQLPWKYPGKGIQMGTMIADSVARLPSDTSINKTGVAVKNGVMYLGNGSRWSSIGGSTSGIDSVTFNSSAWVDTVKYWKSGSATVVGYIDRFDGRISGGFVTRVSGRTFQVTACVYSINGLRYLSLQTNVTLSAVEDSARFDVVVGNSGGSVSVVKGTASRYPTPPALSSTQVAFAFIYVSQDTISVSPPPTQYWGVVNGALTNTVALPVSLGGKVVTSTNPAVGGTLFKTWSITDGGSLDINSGYATADLLYLHNTGGGRRYGFRLTSTGDIILRDYTGSVDRWKIDANGTVSFFEDGEALYLTKRNGRTVAVIGNVNESSGGTNIGIEDDLNNVTIRADSGIALLANPGGANGVVIRDATTIRRTQVLPDKDGTFAMLSDVGGSGGLDTAGVRSIVSDSVKTMVSGEGIVFDEITPDSIKVSVDTAWLSAKIDSALAKGPKIWRGYITDYDSDSALIVQTNTLESNALVGWSFTKVPSTTGNYQFTFSSVYSSDKVNFLLSTFRSLTNDVLVVPYALYDSGGGFIDIHTRDVGDNNVNIGTGQFDRLYLQITIEK